MYFIDFIPLKGHPLSHAPHKTGLNGVADRLDGMLHPFAHACMDWPTAAYEHASPSRAN